MTLFLVFFWAILFAGNSRLQAAEQKPDGAGASGGDATQKVGGDYKVAKIERQISGVFYVEFQAIHPTGRFDQLRLESDHVHVAVKVGQVLRLSAEVMGENGPLAEVSQVVLFIPGQSGHVPVWLLSKKALGRDLKAVRYLEMHAPANDFVIM